MGAETLHQLCSSALKLPQAKRAELAHALVTSLNASADANAGREWDDEILHRLAKIDAGTARYIDQDEFRRHTEERLSNLSCVE